MFLKQWSRCFFTGIFCLQNPLSESGSQAALVKCPIRDKIQPVLPVYYKIVIIGSCAIPCIGPCWYSIVLISTS